MKKVITFLILGIILLSIMVVYKTRERLIDISNKEKLEKGVGEDESQELPQLKPGASEGADESNGGGRASRETGSIENKTLPSDIETQPCGSYFGEYAVCAGTCPSGSCAQEGRSCYCKEV